MAKFFVIGIFLSYFMCILLLFKKGKNLSDKLLMLWLFIIGTHLLDYSMYYSGIWQQYPHMIAIGSGFPFLHGPLFYFYVKYSLRNDIRFKPFEFVHFLPVVVYYLSVSPFYFYSAADKLLVIQGDIPQFDVINNFALIGFCFSGIGYPLYSLRLLKRYHRLMHQNFSFEESINHKWLVYLIFWIFSIFGTIILVLLIQNALHIKAPFNLELIFYTMIILFILFVGFYGIQYRGIFTETSAVVQVDDDDEENKAAGNYQKTGLKTDDAKIIHNQLLALMTKDKPFLEPRLTLGNLASMLGVTVHHLSQVINQFEGRNFYDFVNHYRVEEFKKRVENPQYSSFSILAIALDSGFNSKSSFNQVFKKLTGQTPSEYCKCVC